MHYEFVPENLRCTICLCFLSKIYPALSGPGTDTVLVSTVEKSSGSSGFVVVHGCRQGQLPIGSHFIAIIFQQSWHVCVGNAVMVAAETDIVFFQLDGPKGSIEFPVLVLPVHVHGPHKSHQQHHHNDDDSQNDDVKLGPWYIS